MRVESQIFYFKDINPEILDGDWLSDLLIIFKKDQTEKTALFLSMRTR